VRSHLIPAIAEPTSASMEEGFVIDHRRLKERMSSIVRSKEGKMVNINARLPFNLHNKKLSATIDASSSGSRSRSSHRPSLNSSPLSPPLRSHEHIQGYVVAPLDHISHLDSTPGSRENSVHESEVSSTRTPILNVRLVKNLPAGLAARRGRPRRKGGESTSIGSGSGIQEESVPANIGLPCSDGTVADNTPRAEDFCLRAAETVEPKPMVSVSPASTVDFIIQDTGPLTVTWGD
jgi:hypothetical protein